MWVFLAAACLGFSSMLLFGLVGALATGELRQYAKGVGIVIRVLKTDPSGFWFEVGGLALFALLLLGVGVFAICAYMTMEKSSDAG
jgi:hypothetical protein